MSSLIEYHGRMQVVQNKFIGEKSGQAVYPAGTSLFWSSAASKYFNAGAIKSLKEQFNAQIVRCAMTAWSGWSDGYTTNPTKYVNHVVSVVDAAIQNGMYVIIDWHCEGDNSGYVEQAKTFFRDMAQRYGKYSNIIYEIWNEPTKQSWNQFIRPYCVAVVEEIRKWDSKNLILCGTETWSQKVEDAAKNPIQDPNIAYVLHFYSNLHGPWLYQNKAKLGVPVFVSEWGTPGAHPNTAGFVKWLEENQIPHCSWALNNKAEPLSYLEPSCTDVNGPWDEKELTPTGEIFLGLLKNWKGNTLATSVPVQPVPVPVPVPDATPGSTLSIRIEAEKYKTASAGVRTQPTEDENGGLNVGWIQDRSWMSYNAKLVPGKYRVEYRVASVEGGQLRIDTQSGKVIFGTLNIPKTGGWQKWTTISHEINLEREYTNFGIFAIKGGWNLNWVNFTKI